MKKPAILVVQFRVAPESATFEQGVYRRIAGEEFHLIFKDIFNDLESWSNPENMLAGCDGVILGGSGELYFDGGHHPDHEARKTTEQVVKRAAPFLQYVFEHDIPTLGVCFGHQLIAAHRGGKVAHGKEHSKSGTHSVRVCVDAHPLLEGVPLEWHAQYGHKDVVAELPHGARVIARGELCSHAMLCYSSAVCTTQFHPELTAEDVRVRLEQNPEYLPEGKSAHEIVEPSPHAERILKNFFAMVKKQGK